MAEVHDQGNAMNHEIGGCSECQITDPSGRYDASKPNSGNTPKGEYIHPMLQKTAVEITDGKKYLMLIEVKHLDERTIASLRDNSHIYETYFKGRGVDISMMVVDDLTKVALYELEGAPCQLPQQ